MDELDETVLNIQQRQKRGLIMRRYKAKIERAKELSQKRMADDKKIKKRAYAQARQIVRKRVAGKRGAEYEKLGPSEKMAIDRAIDKKAAAIKKLAIRLIPKVKQAEQQRLHTFMKGQAIHNFGKPEGHHTEKASPGSAVNEELNLLFAEAFNNEQDVDQTNDANDVQMKKKKDDSAKGKSKSASIKMYNKFGEAIVVSKSVFEGLTKKSERSGVDIETLAEVYSRGRDAWVDNEKISQEQYAFARVNSYINEGSAYYELDADLHGEELSEKRGLWDNIHAKRKRIKAGSGERMRKPGSKGAPTAQDFRDAQESVEIDEAEMSLYDKIQAKRAEMRKNPEPEKEPPYKRKPALTAHDRDRRRLDKEDDEAQAQIRKRLRKEDVNLNELKTSTLKSYVNKAPASSENLVKAALYQRNEKKKAALLKKSQNRETGVRNAIDRIMQREETELDEMKTVTNRSHAKMLEVKVGGKAHSYKKYGWGLHHPTYGPLKDEKFNSKAEMKAAMEKHPHYNPKLSEETELDESTMSSSDAHKLSDRHVSAAIFHKKNGNMAGYRAHANHANDITDSILRAGRDMPVRSTRLKAKSDKIFSAHPHKSMNEEVELSESKPAVGSYHHVDEDGAIGRHVVTGVHDGVVYTQNVKTKKKFDTPLRHWKSSSSPIKEETELDEAVSKIDTHADMLFKKHGSNVAQNHINQHAAVYGLNKDRLTKAVVKKTNIASPNAKAKPTLVHDVDHMPGRTISAADAIKQTRDVHAAWAARRAAMKKEETQIDEISQSTAKSYVSKAFKDSDARAEKMRAQAFGNTTMTDKEDEAAFKKQMNRGRGINLALGKLGHKPMGSVRKTGVKVMAKEDADLEESNNTPYVRPHIEKGSTKQTGWKASNKHGRVKYFGMDFKKSAEKHAGISEECECDEKQSVGTKVRKKMEIVDRKPKTPGVYTKQAEVKNKIIDEEGNVQNDPKKRLMGTDSLVNAYKKDTPGQGGDINESFNIAFAAGVGVSLTAADLGMKAQGGFALHPSVIAEMEARELEEDAVSAEKKPVYMPPRRKQDGSYTAAKTVLRKSGRKIIDAKEPEDVDSDEHDGK